MVAAAVVAASLARSGCLPVEVEVLPRPEDWLLVNPDVEVVS